MKTNRSRKLTLAGLFAAALLFTQLTAQALIVGPYIPEANTLHLWHMDASAVPVPDEVVTGGTNLVKIANGATLGTNSYTGFGTALNTLDGGQDNTNAVAKDAYLTASSAATPTIVAVTVADPTTGAFTMEALVWIGFDPAKNLGTVATGGNGRNTSCEIMTGEGANNANRIFQLRIAPIGTVSGNTTVRLEFANVHQVVQNQAISIAIPTTGDDAIVSNNWYHVAVAYNGLENTADNITFYWTLLDPSRTNANVIGTSSMQFDLSVAPSCLAFGALAARAPITGNFLGFIDEARISNIARASNEMMFSATAPDLRPVVTTQPANQTVAVGQSAGFGVTASGAPTLAYQWRHNGTEVNGATQYAYSIAAAQFTDAGSYDVVITNTYGGVTSTVATLTVRTPVNLTWLGTQGSDWDTNLVNWITDTSVNVAYTSGDNVTFDATGSGTSFVNLTGPLAPSAVVVNAASDYTLNTSVSGGIVGVSRLTKSGAGTLVLDTDNSYNGPTVIQGGTVQIGAGGSRGSLGTGPVTNNSAIVVNRTGNVSFNNTLAGTGSLTSLLAATVAITGTNTLSGPIVLNAGTLSLTGPQAVGNSTSFTLNAPAGVAGGTALTLSGGVTLRNNVTLSLLGTTEVPDSRCNINTGNDGVTNSLNGPMVVSGSGSIQFITGTSSDLDINSSVSAPDFTGKFVFRGGGVCHLYGTINLPSANHISTTDTATWVIHSTGNSWTNSNFAGGIVRLAANNALPPGLILSLAATLDLAGFNQQLGGLTNTAGAQTITNSSTTSDSTLTLATADSWTFGGVIKDAALGGTGKLGLTISGGGTLTLTGVSTFTGDANISAGTLALSGAGTLNSTNGTIRIAAGATFDVSGVTTPPYAVRTGKTLSCGGVSGGATINGALNENGGGFLVLTYVSGTPAVNVTGGALTLHGCATTVTVSGGALGVGSYKLISAGAGGSVDGTLPASVVVGGSGLGANLAASLRIAGGELWLDVATAVVSHPVINSFSYDGASLILSGTNGIEGNTYYVLASTNVAAPLINWQPVFTNQFGPGGSFSVTNAVSPAIPARFYLLQVP